MIAGIVPAAAGDQPAQGWFGQRRRRNRSGRECHQRRSAIRWRQLVEAAGGERGREVQPIERLRRRPREVRIGQQSVEAPSDRPGRSSASAPSRSNAWPVRRADPVVQRAIAWAGVERDQLAVRARSRSRWPRRRCSARPAAWGDRAPARRDTPARAARPGLRPPRRPNGNRSATGTPVRHASAAASPICQVRWRSG